MYTQYNYALCVKLIIYLYNSLHNLKAMLTSISKIHITTIMKVILIRFTLYKKEVTIFQQIFKVSLSVNGL